MRDCTLRCNDRGWVRKRSTVVVFRCTRRCNDYLNRCDFEDSRLILNNIVKLRNVGTLTVKNSNGYRIIRLAYVCDRRVKLHLGVMPVSDFALQELPYVVSKGSAVVNLFITARAVNEHGFLFFLIFKDSKSSLFSFYFKIFRYLFESLVSGGNKNLAARHTVGRRAYRGLRAVYFRLKDKSVLFKSAAYGKSPVG